MFSRIILSCLLICSSTWPEETCFVAIDAESGHIVAKEGQGFTQQFPPCSTFKIALSLMGFDLGILLNEGSPSVPYTGYPTQFESWKTPQTPHSWMQRSVVWYSQVLTQQIGMRRMKRYLAQFHYGNQDLSGEKGKDNGLTCAWLSSSLQITPLDQLLFLQKLVRNQLPVSLHALLMTKKILMTECLDKGWTLFAKGGTGFIQGEDGEPNYSRILAWYVGWIEKEGHSYIFVLNIHDLNRLPCLAETKETALKYLKASKIL